mmetsp:Transcript_3710/g.7210  ORF Transcript_3710/g.7210 Transcript_3710/m.7210 type:complete len:228 (-) Transcript_3710:161-844(-)
MTLYSRWKPSKRPWAQDFVSRDSVAAGVTLAVTAPSAHFRWSFSLATDHVKEPGATCLGRASCARATTRKLDAEKGDLACSRTTNPLRSHVRRAGPHVTSTVPRCKLAAVTFKRAEGGSITTSCSCSNTSGSASTFGVNAKRRPPFPFPGIDICPRSSTPRPSSQLTRSRILAACPGRPGCGPAYLSALSRGSSRRSLRCAPASACSCVDTFSVDIGLQQSQGERCQ